MAYGSKRIPSTKMARRGKGGKRGKVNDLSSNHLKSEKEKDLAQGVERKVIEKGVRNCDRR